MKKFLSAILSFAMIFALSIPAFAADITVAPTETVTNEYQSMLELQKISNATLAAEGYTPSEIETIRNTDQIFDDHIALLNTLSAVCKPPVIPSIRFVVSETTTRTPLP